MHVHKMLNGYGTEATVQHGSTCNSSSHGNRHPNATTQTSRSWWKIWMHNGGSAPRKLGTTEARHHGGAKMKEEIKGMSWELDTQTDDLRMQSQCTMNLSGHGQEEELQV